MNSVNQQPKYPVQTWKEPEDQGQTILNAVYAATYSIDISIYELGDPQLIIALKVAKQKGVKIRIMFNGQFFKGNNSSNPKYAQQYGVAYELLTAPGTNQAEIQWSSNNFNITHQKTIIIDARSGGTSVTPRALVMTLNLSAYQWLPNLISSENFQFWGNNYPYPGKGTRDFGVILQDPTLVNEIETIFESDFSNPLSTETNKLKHSDNGLVWSNGSTGIEPAAEGEYPADGHYPLGKPPQGIDQGNARKAHLDVINTAKDSLLIYNEEMNDIELVEQIASVAKEGVKVQILMTEKNTNPDNFNYITDAGGEIRLFPNTGMYIHAKMLLADYGQPDAIAYVGSQNISMNSLNYNRELGVLISGSIDTQLFHDTFLSDWNNDTLTPWKSTIISAKSDQEATCQSNESKYTPMTCGPLLAQKL